MKPIGSGTLRLLFLIFYIFLLFGANRIAFDSWLPAPDENGLWFGAGLLSLLLSSFLVNPYFERPANHIASAIVALTACWFAFDWETFEKVELFIAISLLIYLLFVAVVSACAIILCSEQAGIKFRIGTTAREIADLCGNDKFLFSVVIISAVFLFHRQNTYQVFTILLFLMLVVLLRPESYLVGFINKCRLIWGNSEVVGIAGEIAGYDEPGIILVRQGEKMSKYGDYLLINDQRTKPQLSQVLGYFGRDSGILLRAKLLNLPNEAQKIIESLSTSIATVTEIKPNPQSLLRRYLDENVFIQRSDEFLGLVSENTSINKLYVEIIKEGDVSEGAVLEATIKEIPVLYQITDGLTREEIVFQKNTRGFARAEARKIGQWDSKSSGFKTVKWIPEMHSPVFRSVGSTEQLDETAIGNLPYTNLPIRIKNIHELVTHNTAILGILGVGKSFLAIEILERMFAEGVKVVCLDLTNQYAKELAEFYNEEEESKQIDKIREAGEKDRNNIKESRSEGGSFENLRVAIHEDLAKFMSDECASKLKIYNPAQFGATIQTSDRKNKNMGGQNWMEVAAFREITSAEVTRIVTESCLELSQDEMRDTAKVCLVFEEAHSLVPEYNNLAVDSDKHAVAGTARAILQGRKYGMGCLLISQRTANVTKTILNQCNTILAFRTFDDTGMAFLSNYLGSDYAHTLPSLEERNVVFFGKASSCENPIIMKVNDRKDFITRFRKKYPITNSKVIESESDT